MKCVVCAKKCIGDYCFQHKPRKPMQTKTPMPRPTKPMNKVGKVQKATNNAVAKWKRTQKPNHQGYFNCYMCGVWTTYLEAEHTLSKARHPSQRTNTKILRPVCSNCNSRKGSKDSV